MKSEAYKGKDGKYHFVYITKVHDKITGLTHRYFGKHSTTNLNDGYIGSSKTLSGIMESPRLKRGEITVECNPYIFFDSSFDAYHYEGQLVTRDFIKNVDGILNINPGMDHNQSKRTAEGLQAAKARGVKLGGIRGNVQVEGLKKAADERAESYRRIVTGLLDEGKTISEVTDYLNANGITTKRGAKFSNTITHRLIKRLGLKTSNTKHKEVKLLSDNVQTDGMKAAEVAKLCECSLPTGL